MAEPDHHKYREMLHAYELGLLSEEERRLFELHLMECNDCFEKVSSFAESAVLLNEDSDIKEMVAGEVAKRFPEKEKSRSRSRRLIPVFSLAALALIILLVQPWHIDIGPGLDAYAASERIAVLPFKNLTDPEDSENLGKIISSLLTTDLSQSDLFQVISEQRVNDEMARLYPDTGVVRTMDEISSRLGAKLILSGTIVQSKPNLVVNAILFNSETGITKAAGTFAVDGEESVFKTVDKIAGEIRTAFADLKKESTFDPRISDITTDSREAYSHYLNGLEYFYHSQSLKAEEEFDLALAEDSSIAMAYYYLSFLKGQAEVNRMINLAIENIDNTGVKEKMYIQSRHSFMEGNTTESLALLSALLKRFPDEKYAAYLIAVYDYSQKKYMEAIDYLNRALEIDPNYAPAWNQISYCYSESGDLEKALEANQRYIELTPNQPNPYDSRGDIYVKFHEFDKAIESFEQAIAEDSSFSASLYKTAGLYLMKGDYANAEKYYRIMIGDSNIFTRNNGYNYLSYVYSYQGDLYGAMETLSMDQDTRQKIADRGEYDYAFFQRALIYDELGLIDSAITQIDRQAEIIRTRNPNSTVPWAYLYLRLLVENGRRDEADAIAETIKEQLEKTGQNPIDYYWFLKGIISLTSGDYTEAIALMEKAEETYSGQYFFNYNMGLANYLGEDYIRAVYYFEKNQDEFNTMTLFLGIWKIRSYYYLGDCYEKLGPSEKALDMYRRFLKHWGERQPPTDLSDSARKRIEILEQAG